MGTTFANANAEYYEYLSLLEDGYAVGQVDAGVPSSAATDYGLGSYVIVDGQSIQFSLDAASKRFDIPASQQKDSWSPKVEYTATEKLRFRIQGTIFAADRVDLPLEKQLRAVMKAIVEISVSLREHDEAIKKQHAIWEEQARVRREAETLQKKLFEDIENWSKSERIRRFIARLSSELEKNPAAKTDYAERWLLWAGNHLAHLDPFSGGLEEFFEHYQQNEWSRMSRRR